jgi:hypothetical protein
MSHIQLAIVQNVFCNAQASLLYTFKLASSSTTSYQPIVAFFAYSVGFQTNLSNTQLTQLIAQPNSSAIDEIGFQFINAVQLSQKLLFIAALVNLFSVSNCILLMFFA